MSVVLEREAKRKQESRDIVKTIIDFGVNEDQKIDIMFFLSMSLENNKNMKEITSFLKNYKNSINIDENKEDNIIKKPKLIT
jgi:hypothetical protein